MKSNKQILACITLSISMILSTFSTSPVFGATSEVGDYEDIKERYESLYNDMNRYTDETEAVGLLLNVYKAAAKDISEISSDRTNETKNLESIQKSIEAKSNTASISNGNSSLYKEYLAYIKELIPMVKESAADQEIYNKVSLLLLNSNQSMAQVISEELLDYKEEYNNITEEYEDLINSYSFVKAIGQTGEDPDGNGYVFVDGKFYRYDKDGGAYMEESLNKVFDAYDSTGTIFSFYTEGGRLCVYDSLSDVSDGWYDSTPWDYEQEINKIQEEVKIKLEEINVTCKEVIEKVPELNNLIGDIELATDGDVLNNIKDPLINFTKDYNILKKQYAGIKEIIYSGNLNSKNIKDVDINRIVKSLENQLSQCEQLRNVISKTLTSETLSADNELALNKLYESLGETSSTISKDISTFKFVNSLVGSNNEAIAQASDLLKKVELLENETSSKAENKESIQLTTLKQQNKELEDKISALTSSNSGLVGKINSLTKNNSSLSNPVTALKEQAVAKAAQTSTAKPVTTTGNVSEKSNFVADSNGKTSATKPTTVAKKETSENNNQKTKDLALGSASLEPLSDKEKEALITSATGVVSTPLTSDEYAFLGDEATDGVVDSVNLSFKDLNSETESIYSDISASELEEIEGVSESVQKEKNSALAIAISIIAGATVIALGSLSYVFIKRKKEMVAEMLEDEDLEDIYDEDDELEETPSFESRFEAHSLEGAFSEEEHMIAQTI